MSDATPLAAATRYECPIRDCDWTHTEPIPRPGRLEDVQGFGQMPVSQLAAHTHREYAARVETVLAEHMETHTALEFMREISALRSELAETKQRKTA